MKKDKSRSDLLSEYALITAVFIGANTLKADIVYTDVDPDIMLDLTGETDSLDIDNNGSVNFTFGLNKWVAWTPYETIYLKSVWCLCANDLSNQIAGSRVGLVTILFGYDYFYYPYAMPIDFTINGLLSFQDNGWQTLARLRWDSFGMPESFKGHWTPPVDEKFLGAQFTGDDGYMHYGWIRCSEVDSLDAFIIKDYAYESVPGRPIITGMTSGTSLGVDENKEELSELYSNGNILYISGSLLQQNAEVNIFNLQGQLVFSDFVAAGIHSISLSDLQGDFLVQYISGPQKISKKLFFF